MLRDNAMAKHLQQAKIPVVDVDVLMQDVTWVGRVATDDAERINMAFHYFRSKSFLNFAYYAPRINRYPDQRSLLFQKIVQEAGFKCFALDTTHRNEFGWAVDPAQIAKKIRSTPGPLAVFAPDPVPARQLSEICQWEKIRVPDDVAILAGDTDELLCQIAFPPISSIELDCFKIGAESCSMLEGMMNGQPVPNKPVFIPPLRVISRHSTEILAVADDDVAEALRLIRSKACEGLRVSELLDLIPISRRSLEQKFRDLLGRSIGEEIRRARLENARQLLVGSDMPMAMVARVSGFSSGVEMSHAFRKYEGIKPSDLRSHG